MRRRIYRPTPQSPGSKRCRRRRIAGLLVSLIAIILFVVDYWAFPYGAIPQRGHFNEGTNGLWLRYTWYFGEKSPEDLRELPLRLKERQVQSAWFHVRSIRKTGRLYFHHPDMARKLTAAVHREAPGVKAIAWVYAGNRRGGEEVDLTDTTVRRAMVAEAIWLTTVCGFDGIQWDYEICDDNDPDLLNLLRETRAALPPVKILSVATPLWMPPLLNGLGWSEAYYTRVAALCDEIAVMCYDSGFLTPRSYVWIVAQQVPNITRAAAKGNSHCRVIFGVPSYGKGLISHNPRAENLHMALLGVRQGVLDSRTNQTVFAGTAPFADYTMEPNEWKIWRDLWLSPAD